MLLNVDPDKSSRVTDATRMNTSQCTIKPDPLVPCTYCHRKGHRAGNCFIKRSNEAVDKQHVRILRTNSADRSPNNCLAKADNVLVVEHEDAETIAAFKRSATGETLQNNKGCRTILLNTISPKFESIPEQNLSLIFLHHEK